MKHKKKYRWNISIFLMNIVFMLMMVTVGIMTVTFFAAPALDITIDQLRSNILTMSNIIVVEMTTYFILWVNKTFLH